MDKRKLAKEVVLMVCDDIRHELGHKFSLMGIYNDIIIDSVPAIMPKIHLGIFLRGVKHKIKSVQVALVNPNGERMTLPDLKLSPKFQADSNSQFDICVAPLKIKEPGKFVWEIGFDGEAKPTFKHDMVVSLPATPKPSKKK